MDIFVFWSRKVMAFSRMKPADYYHDCLRVISPGLTSDWERVSRAYNGRAYHNLDHLGEMLGHLADLPTSLAPAAAPIFGIALIYHDIVYHAHRKDNEARSADLAVAALRQFSVGEDGLTYCHRLIMATKTHLASDDDEGLLVDLDLAVLARPADSYDDYARGVRQEFSIYPDFLYRPGRKKALRQLLGQEHIYHHLHLRQRREGPARANLTREISTL
jgi:predicted metal-dependent HD superfamily phosphohydrolase